MERKAEMTGDIPVWFVEDRNATCQECIFDGTEMCRQNEMRCFSSQREDGLDGYFVPRDTETPDFLSLVQRAISTAERAMKKYPQPNYVISKIAEESGELVKAAIHYAEGRDTSQHVLEEMIDTLAMLYRLWEEGDQVHGCSPIKEGE